MTTPFASFAFATSGVPPLPPATSPPTRTLPDRLADIKNVKDFGAVGDGVTDDWAAIRAAINWANFSTTASATNRNAAFTGAVAYASSFQATWSGTVLTASSVTGTLAVGQTISGTASFTVASFTYNSGTGVTVLTLTTPPSATFNTSDTIVVSGLAMTSPAGGGPNGSFTPSAVSGSTVTYTGRTGISGTPSGGGSFTVSKTTTITSLGTGTGGAGTYNVAASDNFSTAFTMSSNCVLTASSVTGSISVNDWLLNNGGTDASPSTITFGTRISSVVAGGGGAGVYVLNINQNFASQAMMTVTNVISLTSMAGVSFNQAVFDASNGTVCGNGASTGATSFFVSGGTIVLSFVNGLVNLGDTITISPQQLGTIFFPPGTYLVSQPIYFDNAAGQQSIILTGVMGLSTITGNFANYILARGGTTSVGTVIEKLNVVNTHPNGGGIRAGSIFGGAIRDCTVTANQGISDYNSDANQGTGYFGSFEFSIQNCIVNSGGNYTGSKGIMKQSDGPVTNCKILNYENGFLCAGEEGAQWLAGVYFEKCGSGASLALAPDGMSWGSPTLTLIGCWFKNCGIAMQTFSGVAEFSARGIRIEAANSQAPLSGNGQYGIADPVSNGSGMLINHALLAGITVTGQYDVAAIKINSQNVQQNSTYVGVGATNSTVAANAWLVQYLTPTGNSTVPLFVGCGGSGMPFIGNVANLAADNVGDFRNVNDGTNGLTWSNPVTNTGTHTSHYKARWNGTTWTVVGA